MYYFPKNTDLDSQIKIVGLCEAITNFTKYVVFVPFTVKLVLEPTCIKQSTALKDHCSDTTPPLNSI